MRRWGGDATLRYNYLVDSWNSAADYYYNSPQNSTGPLPDGSIFNLFVDTALADGSLRVGTIPILDSVPKDRDSECSYSVAMYGAQQKVDPYHPDCGNGFKPDGNTAITDTDLNVDGEPNSTTFAQHWIDYLISRYGSAKRGGVQVWSLGNEPDWWHAVHMDIHPKTATYDEILSRGLMYASAIKQADPDALVTRSGGGGMGRDVLLGDRFCQRLEHGAVYVLRQPGGSECARGRWPDGVVFAADARLRSSTGSACWIMWTCTPTSRRAGSR